MDPSAVAKVDARLAAIRQDHGVAIPLAIESGSRAWGFPSPDSDYDYRFIFVRSRDDYLCLFPKRDVMETPLEDELDVNGWDVARAVKLLLKGNAVVIEWLTSPYALRPAAALRWLRAHPHEAVAPMHFPTLPAECDAPAMVRDIVNGLIARKALTRELGSDALPEPVATFIDSEFVAAHEEFDGAPVPVTAAARAQAQEFFGKVLGRIGT